MIAGYCKLFKFTNKYIIFAAFLNVTDKSRNVQNIHLYTMKFPTKVTFETQFSLLHFFAEGNFFHLQMSWIPTFVAASRWWPSRWSTRLLCRRSAI